MTGFIDNVVDPGGVEPVFIPRLCRGIKLKYWIADLRRKYVALRRLANETTL